MNTELLQRIKTAFDAGMGAAEESEFCHALYVSRNPDNVPHCPACDSEKIYRLADNRYRCGHCKYTHGPLTGTWLGYARISLEAWLNLLFAFTDDLTTRAATQLTGLSFPTVLRVFHIIRKAIAVHEDPRWLLYGKATALAPYHRDDTGSFVLQPSPPVFGLLMQEPYPRLVFLPDMQLVDFLQLPGRFVKKGGLIYTDAGADYETLFTYIAAGQAQQLDKQALFTRGSVAADHERGFLPFLRETLNKHHRIDQAKFPFYLYESQYRYLHHKGLFDKVFFLLNKVVSKV